MAPLASPPHLRPAGCSAAVFSVWTGLHARKATGVGVGGGGCSLVLRHDLQQHGLALEVARQDFSPICRSQYLKVLMMALEG